VTGTLGAHKGGAWDQTVWVCEGVPGVVPLAEGSPFACRASELTVERLLLSGRPIEDVLAAFDGSDSEFGVHLCEHGYDDDFCWGPGQ
jgi:hypothetical protein